MLNPLLKVIVSRPRVVPARAPTDLQRRDFCWTSDGELLAPPMMPCSDVDTCGCAWSFAGVSSARAVTWGVVEHRSEADITAEIREGEHLAGWVSAIADFEVHLAAGIRDLSDRIRHLPVGTVVGIWTIDDERFGIFDRTPPRHALTARAAQRSRRP